MSKTAELNNIISAWWWAERFDSGNLPSLGRHKWRDEDEPPTPGGNGSVAFLGIYNKTKLQKQISTVVFKGSETYNDFDQLGYSIAVYLEKNLEYKKVQIPYSAYLLYALRKGKTSVIHDDQGFANFKDRVEQVCDEKLAGIKSDQILPALLSLDKWISKALGLEQEQEARLDMIQGNWNYRREPVMLDSFYADDLNLVYNAKNDDRIIHDYLMGTDHQEINEDWPFLTEEVSVDNLPMGKWPSEVEFGSSLMQQFAINAITGHFADPHNYIRTVNGPPGTGKTTLLKDVFADMVVQQAKVMANLATPAAGYQKAKAVKLGKYYHNLYPLVPELQGYGIVVTSNNNSAVENISKDFPMLGEINQHAAKDQENEFADRIKKVDFFSGLAGKILAKDDNDPVEDAWGTFAIPMGSSFKTRKALSYNKSLWGYLVHHKTSKGQWEKAVYYFNKQYEKVMDLKQALKQALMTDLTLDKWQQLSGDVKQLTVPYLLDPKGKSNELNEQLREARAELFIEALNLRKKFICYPIKSFKGREKFPVLEAYELYSQAYQLKDEQAVMAFQDLQLLFPVISSTLASFHRMFKQFGESTLDNVFMDEAGQATPLSGVGALWRAKHFIALGDPAQIKPVVTNNPTFLNFIAEEKGVDYDRYLSPDLSVQELADQANYFGHQEAAGEPWIGMPLWVHRRCLDPMFSISNAISYNNHMVKGTPESAKNQWGHGWINSVGKAKDKFVEADARQLVDHIKQRLADKQLTSVTINDIFVISPFTNVVRNLKRSLQKADLGIDRQWVNHNVGTVHTFQGKEAKVVYFVVGTDKSSDGAADWSCEQPNLINVAVTRAKKEFYVIGDAARLKTKPNYSVMYEKLK